MVKTPSRFGSSEYRPILPCLLLEERVDHSANCKQKASEKGELEVFFPDCKESGYHGLLP